MGAYSRFDPELGVVVTDLTGLPGRDRALIDGIFDEIIAIAESLPRRPWVVSCWKDARIEDPAIIEHYGARTADLMRHVAGVVRYAVTHPTTRALLRAQALKHRQDGTRSNVFDTLEEALAAIPEHERLRDGG